MTYNILKKIILYHGQKERLADDMVNAESSFCCKWMIGREEMVFNTGAALLDAVVLAIVSKDTEGTYGYKITQDVRTVIELSESTLYPVLRRLLKDECLEVYDQSYDGRNRRYYKITERGRVQLNLYRSEWGNYSQKISRIFEEARI